MRHKVRSKWSIILMAKYWNQEYKWYEILMLYLQTINIWNKGNISKINLDVFPLNDQCCIPKHSTISSQYFCSAAVFCHRVKPGLHLNMNAACENEAIVQCRCVTEARQTAFGCATNVPQTAKCYPLTVGTSKGICIQYIYVGSICCLGKCRIVYTCTIHSALTRQHASFAFSFCSRSGVNPALASQNIDD